MKKHICLFILIISAFNLSAQVSTVSLNFNSLVNNKDTLELEKRYYFKSIQDSLQVDVLKFYITNIKFIKDETILASVHKKHFLINFEDVLSKRIKTQISDTLKFNKKLYIDEIYPYPPDLKMNQNLLLEEKLEKM